MLLFGTWLSARTSWTQRAALSGGPGWWGGRAGGPSRPPGQQQHCQPGAPCSRTPAAAGAQRFCLLILLALLRGDHDELLLTSGGTKETWKWSEFHKAKELFPLELQGRTKLPLLLSGCICALGQSCAWDTRVVPWKIQENANNPQPPVHTFCTHCSPRAESAFSCTHCCSG